MLPRVTINKADGQTGAVKPSPEGVLAIIAPSEKGTPNQAASFARQDLVLAADGNGPMVEYCAYVMAVSQNQVTTVVPTTTTAASYGSVTPTALGTSVVTAGATAPLDDYAVLFTVVNGCTIGVTGGTYTVSLDGGATTSGVLALGTASSITVALPPSAGGTSSGVSFNFAAGTLLAGGVFTCNVLHARMNNSDLLSALEALRVTRLPWEIVLVDGEASSASIAAVDTWLTTQEASGIFRAGLLNTRHKTLPAPTGETEAAFLTAMTTLTASLATIRLGVGTDAGDMVSAVTGFTMPRPVSLAVAARAMLIPIGEDPAFVGRGAVADFQVASGGNPKWHDEDLFPGLDDLRLMSLRSFGQNGPQGVYITNAPVLSPFGSDYVYLQQIRVMNRACEIAWGVLTTQLSVGVAKKAPEPVTGAVYIEEQDAQRIEGLVNDAFRTPLKGQASGVRFALARNDDLSSNSGATVHGDVQVAGLAYIKRFAVVSKFVKSLAA